MNPERLSCEPPATGYTSSFEPRTPNPEPRLADYSIGKSRAGSSSMASKSLAQ